MAPSRGGPGMGGRSGTGGRPSGPGGPAVPVVRDASGCLREVRVAGRAGGGACPTAVVLAAVPVVVPLVVVLVVVLGWRSGGGPYRGGPGGRPGARVVGVVAPVLRAGVRSAGRAVPPVAARARSSVARSSTTCSAPTIGGVQVPRGSARFCACSRASLSTRRADQTQSRPRWGPCCSTSARWLTLRSRSTRNAAAAGAELNYTIQVVSPEDEDRELSRPSISPSVRMRATRSTWSPSAAL